MSGNDFPKMGVSTAELRDFVDDLIEKAKRKRGGNKESFGGVNWGDIGVVDIEYRLSMLNRGEGPYCVVLVEEASPGCGLQDWLNAQVTVKYPRAHVECEW